MNLMIRPLLRELRDQRRGATRDYRNFSNQMGFLYDELGQELGDIGADTQGAFGGIQEGYTEGIEGIIGALGASSAPDQAAFLNSLGAQAIGGQQLLSNQQGRESAWNASTRRQGGIEGMQVRRNARADLQDVLDDLRLARRDVLGDRGAMVASRLDQLRDRRFDEWLARQELGLARRRLNMEGESSSAFGDFIAGYPTGAGGGGGRRDRTRDTGTRRERGRRRGRRRRKGTTISGFGGGYDPRQMG
ncbi:MAG TPA: hypothetical protein VFQ40_07580 [Actinomycetota bacterium]|nr:hypothetical protein [Actinomycetota bacterium]